MQSPSFPSGIAPARRSVLTQSKGRLVSLCFAFISSEGLLHRPVGGDDAQIVVSEAARAVGIP